MAFDVGLLYDGEEHNGFCGARIHFLLFAYNNPLVVGSPSQKDDAVSKLSCVTMWCGVYIVEHHRVRSESLVGFCSYLIAISHHHLFSPVLLFSKDPAATVTSAAIIPRIQDSYSPFQRT